MVNRKKSSRPAIRKLWSASELKLVRQHAGRKSLSQLARLLKRSEAAVRFKASVEQISLRVR